MIPFLSMKRPQSLRKNRWQVPPPISASLKEKLSQINPVLLQVLYNRGLTHPALIQAFLDGRYIEKSDPFLLVDMDKAVKRIQQAIAQEETVIVYGDFDADGVTSTVLLTEALRELGLSRENAQPYIPSRVDEGYGLNSEAIEKLKKEKGADLIISVDCGIRSVAEVEFANQLGVDMIITDHHSLGSKLPPATAVINPKRESDYPEKMLAGVGIAYKLVQALCQTFEVENFDETDLLDLVAIGTVADLAPLLGENRKLVSEGLKKLNENKRIGIQELSKLSRLNGNLTAESIGFGLGPRINAAGRLAHAYSAARLLATRDPILAKHLAADLQELNQKRQQLTAELGEMAESLIDPEAPILIAADEQFVSGVVGLVASRLSDKFYRPAVIIEKGEEVSRGSCRSIPEFHITEALDTLEHLLERHGGHAQAAGFTVSNENLAEFMQSLHDIAENKLTGIELFPSLSIDAEISLDNVDWALQEELSKLEPTGYANPTPIFLSRQVEVISHRRVGQDGAHLQLTLTAAEPLGPNPQHFSAIAFRQGAWAEEILPQYIDVVYTIGVNEWRGRRNLQLVVQDLNPAK